MDYQDPIGKYALKVPSQWTQLPGPIPGTSELVLHDADGTTPAARLRPTCDYVDVPLAVTVGDRLRDEPHLQHRCGGWQGMDTCLLEERSTATAAAAPLQWEWLAHDTAHGLNIRLMFELFDHTQKAEALAIIRSVRPAK